MVNVLGCEEQTQVHLPQADSLNEVGVIAVPGHLGAGEPVFTEQMIILGIKLSPGAGTCVTAALYSYFLLSAR